MAIPRNKDELLYEIETSYKKLQRELVSIPNNIIKNPMNGHAQNTQMTVLDLMSYLIGWGELIIKWNHSENLDYLPDEGYQWNELGKLAQKFYGDYENYSYEELLQKLDDTVANINGLIRSYNNYDLYSGLWYKKYTRGRMIQFNSSSPYKNAYLRIRKWKKYNT